MGLTELLPLLQGVSSIIVTGPQRSGTTIAAHILSEELGLRYADETELDVYDSVKAKAILDAGNVVLQGPAICYAAHTFGCTVVFMQRPVADIIRSQERINWDFNQSEILKYGLPKGRAAEVKYAAWNEWQRNACASAFDLEYDSLSVHPRWIDPERRRHFHSRQWTAEEDGLCAKSTS